MIQVLKLEKELFDNSSPKSIKSISFGNSVFITDLYLISELLSIDIPIKNRRIFLKNILSFLRYLEFSSKIYENKIPNISRNVFIKFFGRNYSDYKQILKDLEIISNVPHKNGEWYNYKKGLVKNYRIHNNYLKEKELCLVILEEPSKKYNRKFICDIDINDRFKNTIENITINTKNAIEAELNYCTSKKLSSSKLRSRISRILYLKEKRFIKKGKKVGRIYHSFTNLSRISRKFLSVNFSNIDIKNCQPLLLIAYLRKNNYGVDINYKNDCENGIFYDQFFDVKNESRDIVKKQIYKNLLFGFNMKSCYNKRFKEIYPIVWESLKKINLSSSTLASKLQNIESELFNDLIPIKSKYFFTLFDAIYFSDLEDVGELSKKIHSFFKDLDIEVRLEIC